MAELLSPVYAKRVESGLYNSVEEQIVDMKENSLGECEYEKDMTREFDSWKKNLVFKNLDKTEFRTNIIGEIRHECEGTVLCAKGNHYPGGPGEPVSVFIARGY